MLTITYWELETTMNTFILTFTKRYVSDSFLSNNKNFYKQHARILEANYLKVHNYTYKLVSPISIYLRFLGPFRISIATPQNQPNSSRVGNNSILFYKI